VDLATWVQRAVEANGAWAAKFGSPETHPSLAVSDEAFAAAFGPRPRARAGFVRVLHKASRMRSGRLCNR